MVEAGELSRNELLAVGGGGLLVLAGVLPWVSTADIGLNSLTALLIGTAVIGLVVVRDWDRGTQIAAAGIGVLGALLALFRLVEPAGPGGTPAGGIVDVAPGIGVYVALLGGVVITVGGVLAVRE